MFKMRKDQVKNTERKKKFDKRKEWIDRSDGKTHFYVYSQWPGKGLSTPADNIIIMGNCSITYEVSVLNTHACYEALKASRICGPLW